MHQAQLHLHRQLGSGWSADLHSWFYDRIPAYDVGSWIRLDLHVGWRPNPDTRFDLLLSNLLDGQHREADSQFFGQGAEIERAIAFTVTHDF
jgi:iron complex outermembrane receptor protein